MVSEIHSERKLFGAYFIKAIKYNSKLLGRIDTFVELGIHCFWNIFYHLIKYFQKSKVRYENSIENNKWDVNMTIFGSESLFCEFSQCLGNRTIWPWKIFDLDLEWFAIQLSSFSTLDALHFHALSGNNTLSTWKFIIISSKLLHGRRLSDKPGKLTKTKLDRLFHFRSWSSFGAAWPFQ